MPGRSSQNARFRDLVLVTTEYLPDLVPTSSPTSSREAPVTDDRRPTTDLVPRPPSLWGDEVRRDEVVTSSLQTGTTSAYNPAHPSTSNAWQAIVENLISRPNRTGARGVAVAIAQRAGLTPKRAHDLVSSAIRHGYLVAASPRQVRLPAEQEPA